jgi:hypothetical protein
MVRNIRSMSVLGLAAGAVACGSAPREEAVLDRTVDRQFVAVSYSESDARGVHITRDRQVSRAEIAASRAQVWNAVPDAFTAMGLPLPMLDHARGIAATQNFRTSATLGRDRLSTFFDCGSGPAGRYADLRRLVIEVFVAVPPSTAATTRVELRASAVSHPTEGASGSATECSSLGILEERLARALQLRALRPDNGE